MGFPIWAAWIVVAFETAASLALFGIASGQAPSAAIAARDQAGKAARNALWASLLFTLLTAGPALGWRLKFGVWLTG